MTTSNNTFEELKQKYPDEKLHSIPRVPDILDEEGRFQFKLAHKNSEEFLNKLKVKGYLLCEMPANDVETVKVNHGNLFIPYYPNLDQIILLKSVQSFRENTFLSTKESLISQLKLISNSVCQLVTHDECVAVPVKVVLLFDVKDHDKIQHLKWQLENSIHVHSSLSLYFTTQKRVFENSEVTKSSLLAVQSPNSSLIRKVLANFILLIPETKVLELTDRKFICPDEEKQYLSLSAATDKERTISLFGLFFPFFKSKLITLPDINRVPSKLLINTNIFGSAESADEYLGEVKNFWELFLSKLESAIGIIIHDYNSEHLNQIVKEKVAPFQFDWLLCHPRSGFTIFEVAKTKNPECPISAVQNKLTGQTINHLFNLTLIVFSILTAVWKGSQQELADWVEKHIRIVFVFFNTDRNSLGKAIIAKEKVIRKANLPLSKMFLLPFENLHGSESENSVPKLLRLSEDLTLGDSEYSLEHIFDSTGEEYTDDESEGKEVIFAIAATVFSYLLNARNKIDVKMRLEKHEETPLLPEERLKTADPCPCFDIILTPQQNQILKTDSRFLLLVGEPGSGKTSVLLAKAYLAANDEDIESIYFVVPAGKSELEDFVEEFLDRHKLRSKVKCMRIEDLAKTSSFEQSDDPSILSWKQLHKSVLLMDEMYIETSANLLADEDRLFVSLLDIVAHAKQCWIANLQAGQMTISGHMYHKFLLPNYHIASLNVLLRSAHHISAFSTAHIHKSKRITRTTARVPGCFTSSQTKIPLKLFSSGNDIDFDGNTTRNEIQPKFAHDRRVIVFSKRPQFWSSQLEDKSFKKITIVSPSSNFYSVPYTGCEALSVVIIVEELPHEIHDKRTFGLINLAITRAQYEACIFSAEKCYKRMENFLSTQNSSVDKELFEAANNKSFKFTTKSFVDWSEADHEMATKLIQIAIQTSNRKLLDEVLDMYPGEDGDKRIDIRKNLESLDDVKPKEFMDHLAKRIGKQAGATFKLLIMAGRFPRISWFFRIPKISDVLDAGLIAGHAELIDWYFNLVPEDVLRNLFRRYRRLLFCSCQHGRASMLRWALDKLSSLGLEGLKSEEMRSKYSLLFKSDTTLLLTLCYSRGDLEAVQMLLNDGFPDVLLLETFNGKNALQFAIDYEDRDLVELLLSSESRRDIFFGGSTKYGQFSNPIKYASEMNLDEMKIVLGRFVIMS